MYIHICGKKIIKHHFFHKIFFLYIKMSKEASGTYQEYKEKIPKKIS